MIFQIKKIIILLSLVYGCTTPKKVRNVEKVNSEEFGKCVLHQIRVDLSANNFSPYDSVYNEFMESDYKIDILHRRIGQLSKLNRYTFDESSQISKYFTNSDAVFIEKEGRGIPFNFTPKYSAERLFVCNAGVSDQNTNIYVVKLYGKTIYKLYFEEGDFWDLSKSEIEFYDELYRLLTLVKAPMS